MRSLLFSGSTILLFAAVLAAPACNVEEPTSEPFSEPTVEAPAVERGSLGKADLTGSCGAAGEACGSKSTGSCWCDELCDKYGDCCDDYASTCEGEAGCGPDAEKCLDCEGEVMSCAEPGEGGCPELVCPPPNTCGPDAEKCLDCEGEVMSCAEPGEGGCPELVCPSKTCEQVSEDVCMQREDCQPIIGGSCPLCLDMTYQGCEDKAPAACNALSKDACELRSDCLAYYGASCNVCADMSYQGCYEIAF